MNGLTSALLLILALCRMAYLSTFSVLSSMLKRVQPPLFCKTALDFVFDFNFNDSIISIKSLPFVLSPKSLAQLNRPVRSDVPMNKGLLILLFAILLLPSINVKAASFYMDGVCYSDVSVIVERFESTFPQLDSAAGAGGVLSYIAYPTTVSATGLLGSRVDRLNLATGAVTTGFVFSTQLMDCTAKNGFIAVGKVDRTLIVFALILFFILGFNFGHRFYSNNVPGE